MDNTVNKRTSKLDLETSSFSHIMQLEEVPESVHMQRMANLELIKKVLKTDN